MAQNPKLAELEVFIEGFRACPVLSYETITRIGELAIENGPDSFPQSVPHVNDRQFDIIHRASLGDKTKEAADTLDWEESEVVEVREQLLAIFRVPQMSGVIDRAIVGQILPVEADPDKGKSLSKKEGLIVDAFRAGIPNGIISRQLGQSRQQFGSGLHLLVRQRLGANGRTNAVLEAYKRGYREIPDLS